MSEPDKLYFYSQSRDVPPGKGIHEHVKEPERYATLSRYKNFRKVLSNFHVYPFEFEGLTYNSIEHAYHAKKVAMVDTELAKRFSLESGHDIGRGDGLVARRNRKLIELTKANQRKWDDMKMDVMRAAAIEKYKQCKLARTILKATNDAELWHIVTRGYPVRFAHLEEIRDTL